MGGLAHYRHTAFGAKVDLPGLTMRRKPKKHVPPTSQVGAVQTAILEWLLTQEERIQASGTEKEKLELADWGVPWRVAHFCRSCERACRADGYPDSSKISTSLRLLDVKKQLIERRGSRTSHVKLTRQGREHAEAKRADPRTWQEKRAEETARRRAYAIASETLICGSQMSTEAHLVNLAREAYYLTQLFNMRRGVPHEARMLSYAVAKLRVPTSRPRLLSVVQRGGLSLEQAREVGDILDAVQR